MNCERCQTELEDFLYGELGQARSAEIRAHLAACATCSAARAELERENEVFARFYEQTAVEPAAEMWQAIRARIGEESLSQSRIENQTGWLERLRAGTFGWLLAPALLRQVAFAILLIALSVALTTIYLRRGERGEKNLAGGGAQTTPTPAPQPSLAPTPAPSPSNELAGGNEKTRPTPKANHPAVDRVVPKPQLTDQELMNRQIARAEREYQKAVRMLDQAIAKRRNTLDPALVKEFETSLALIDSSIAASRRALRERPDDPTAGQFLLAAYAKKVELMQDIAMK
jgi:hypothetical protein